MMRLIRSLVGSLLLRNMVSIPYFYFIHFTITE
nr:MAG TPA: hypothetical protein [Caudoviricetes sp.]DAS60974.1 MAG TPA: hypothetical protein [Caudoviricetes sp.]